MNNIHTRRSNGATHLFYGTIEHHVTVIIEAGDYSFQNQIFVGVLEKLAHVQFASGHQWHVVVSLGFLADYVGNLREINVVIGSSDVFSIRDHSDTSEFIHSLCEL